MSLFCDPKDVAVEGSRKHHIEAWFWFYGRVCQKIIDSERKLGLGYLFEVLPPFTQHTLLVLHENKSIRLVKEQVKESESRSSFS